MAWFGVVIGKAVVVLLERVGQVFCRKATKGMIFSGAAASLSALQAGLAAPSGQAAGWERLFVLEVG